MEPVTTSIAASAAAFAPKTLAGWATFVKDIATGLAVIIGGVWALWKFVIQREARAKIQFSLELNEVGRLDGKIVVEAVAVVENKGFVRHQVRNFRFDLHYLSEQSKVVNGDERINEQILFQPAVIKKYWIPPSWLSTFVDPGVTQRYTYVAALPDDTVLALLYAKFKYPNTDTITIPRRRRSICARSGHRTMANAADAPFGTLRG